MKFSQLFFKNWRFWKTQFFWVGHFGFFFFKLFFVCLIPMKTATNYVNWWDSILMLSLVSSKFLAMRNITLYSVWKKGLRYWLGRCYWVFWSVFQVRNFTQGTWPIINYVKFIFLSFSFATCARSTQSKIAKRRYFSGTGWFISLSFCNLSFAWTLLMLQG